MQVNEIEVFKIIQIMQNNDFEKHNQTINESMKLLDNQLNNIESKKVIKMNEDVINKSKYDKNTNIPSMLKCYTCEGIQVIIRLL